MAQSNGLLAFPIVALAHFSVSRRRAALLFALLTLLAFALYFTDYSRPLRTPHYVSTWHAIKATLVGWLQLQGNILPSLALPIGVFTTLAWVYLAARGYWRRNPVLFWFGVWALATLGTVSLGRANYGDEFVVTQVRYRYYGIVFLAVTYLALMEHLCSKPLRTGLWLLLGVASVQVYITEASLGWGWVRKTLADGKVAANYLRLEGRAPEESLWFPKVHDVAPILGYAERAGLWRLPAFPAYIGQATAPARAAQVAWLPMTLDRPLLGRRSLGVSGSLNLPLGASCSESATLVWLEHAGRRHYYNAERFARADKVEFFRRPCRAFATLIDTAALAPGEYQVGVAVSERGRVVAEQAAPWRASLNAGAAP